MRLLYEFQSKSSHGKPPDFLEVNDYRPEDDEVLLQAIGSLFFLSLDIPRLFLFYFLVVIIRMKLLSYIGLDECGMAWCFRDGKHFRFWLLKLYLLEKNTSSS